MAGSECDHSNIMLHKNVIYVKALHNTTQHCLPAKEQHYAPALYKACQSLTLNPTVLPEKKTMFTHHHTAFPAKALYYSVSECSVMQVEAIHCTTF